MIIILFGMKNCGKSTLAKKIADEYLFEYSSIDYEIEQLNQQKKNEELNFREIFQKYGKIYFLQLEREVIFNLLNNAKHNTIIDCSGSAPLTKEHREMLKRLGKTIYLKTDPTINYQRIIKNGIPAFFNITKNPEDEFKKIWKERTPIFIQFADYIIEAKDETPAQLLEKFKQLKIV